MATSLRNTFKLSLVIFGLVSFAGCKSTVEKWGREAKYSAWDMVGVEKRDLFKKEVEETKDSQKKSGEAVQDALTQLKAMTGFKGGDAEKQYNKYNDAYTKAEKRALELKANIKQVQNIANDLFEEWEKEIEQISTPDLKEKSRTSLNSTKSKYANLEVSLKKSEAKLDPVLKKLKDHVLFLKHNLNAKAFSALTIETVKIQKDIDSLVIDLNKSIAEAEKLTAEL